MIDVVWILVAVGFWGPTFEEVTVRATPYETRAACMSKRAELIDLAASVQLRAQVECVPYEYPAAK